MEGSGKLHLAQPTLHLVSFHNLLAENLSRLPSVEFFFITNEKLHFHFDYLVLFVAALFWILSCSFPTFLSTEGNTNVREHRKTRSCLPVLAQIREI